ncbi:MAG: peptide chain release factor N(5)-glutamine methyltransferase [Luminiphilus sp.]|nr:peptide chain release factor N(5)-glutamine methyltransferase [Luminiphilus sp.]
MPRNESEILLFYAFKCDRSWLYTHGGDQVEGPQVAQFLELLVRRQSGEPLAYILGQWEFWSLRLKVTPDVLIPRVDTELLVQWAVALLPEHPKQRCLDLGTGSGAVALAVKHELPSSKVTAVDLSGPALNVARANGEQLQLEVEWLLGSWFEPVLARHFDLVVANPPYIREADEHLRQGDLPAEPNMALTSGIDGLQALRQLIADGQPLLEPGGWMLLEHGWDQGAEVRDLMKVHGWRSVETRRDLAGRERVTGGHRPL